MPKKKKNSAVKSHYLKNNYYRERRSGSLGGEISSELGFLDLEAAVEYAEQFKPWNAEEWDLLHENIRATKQQKKKK